MRTLFVLALITIGNNLCAQVKVVLHDTIVPRELNSSDSALMFSDDSKLFLYIRSLEFSRMMKLNGGNLYALAFCFNHKYLFNIQKLNSNVGDTNLVIFRYRLIRYDSATLKNSTHRKIVVLPDSFNQFTFYDCWGSDPYYGPTVIAYNKVNGAFYKLCGFLDNDLYNFYLNYYVGLYNKSYKYENLSKRLGFKIKYKNRKYIKYPKIGGKKLKREIMNRVKIETNPLKGVINDLYLKREYCR